MTSVDLAGSAYSGQDQQLYKPDQGAYHVEVILPKRSDKVFKQFKDATESLCNVIQLATASGLDAANFSVWRYTSENLDKVIDAIELLTRGIPSMNISPQCVGKKPEKKVSYRLLIPSKLAYRLIGVQGKTIQLVRNTVGCDVFVAPTNRKDHRILCLVAPITQLHQLRIALQLVALATRLSEVDRSQQGYIVAYAEKCLGPKDFTAFKMVSQTREEQEIKYNIRPATMTNDSNHDAKESIRRKSSTSDTTASYPSSIPSDFIPPSSGDLLFQRSPRSLEVDSLHFDTNQLFHDLRLSPAATTPHSAFYAPQSVPPPHHYMMQQYPNPTVSHTMATPPSAPTTESSASGHNYAGRGGFPFSEAYMGAYRHFVPVEPASFRNPPSIPPPPRPTWSEDPQWMHSTIRPNVTPSFPSYTQSWHDHVYGIPSSHGPSSLQQDTMPARGANNLGPPPSTPPPPHPPPQHHAL